MKSNKEVCLAAGIITLTVLNKFAKYKRPIQDVEVANVVSGGLAEYLESEFEIENWLFSVGVNVERLKRELGVKELAELLESNN